MGDMRAHTTRPEKWMGTKTFSLTDAPAPALRLFMYLNKYSFFCDNGLSFELKIIQIRIFFCFFFLFRKKEERACERERTQKKESCACNAYFNLWIFSSFKIVRSFASFKMKCFKERFLLSYLLPSRFVVCLINNLNIGPTCSKVSVSCSTAWSPEYRYYWCDCRRRCCSASKYCINMSRANRTT